MKARYPRLILELIAWTGFIVFPLILFPTLKPFVNKGNVNPALQGLVITHSLLIVFYYFNYYYALPRFYYTRKTGIYIPLMLGCLLSLILVLQIDPGFNPLPTPPFHYAKTAFIASIIVRFVMVVLLSMGVSNYQRLRQAEAEKLKNELAFLKMQINPHFFFNTLNSIYALTVKKSDDAPQSVAKLSSIMRYVISDTANDLVPLEKELNYVSAYIDLERLRLTSKVKLSYTAAGQFGRRQIAPMLLLPIIENVFKHGVSTSEESEISIDIALTNHTLVLATANTRVRSEKAGSTGLGLGNVRKRLSLLYAGKHELKIEEREKDFSVKLILMLNA